MEKELIRSSCILVIGAILLIIMATYCNGEEKSGEIHSIRAYIVKEGDTLWDISRRFYNNPHYWPKIWGRNPYIQNPHWIYPGEPIYLYSEIIPFVETYQPPEEKQITKEMKEMPLTIPFSEFYISGILSEDDLRKAGGIVGSYEDKLLLSQGDLVYIQLKENEKINVGQRYGIFRAGRTLHHPRTGAILGKIYKILGYTEILDTGDGKVVSARIISSRDAIHVGDGVRIFEPMHKQIVVKPSKRLLEGYIIAQSEDIKQIAQHDIVFVSLGIQDGMEVGDQLFVMEEGKTVKGYTGKGEVQLPDRNVAKLVVVKTDRTASSALVTDSQNSFLVGSLVRTWMAQPAQ